MSHKVSARVSDAIYEALCKQARTDGQASRHGDGVSYVVRKAVKYWLTKTGHSASELDMTDAEYQDRYGMPLGYLPGTRKHSEQDITE